MSNSPAVPVETGGYEVTRFNALRHGILSRYVVLPWEDADEYRGLVEALVTDHAPVGVTEEHLVEELAGVLWRKRRLRLAEAAAHRRGLKGTFAPYHETVKAALVHLDATKQTERVVDAIRSTDAETASELTELAKDEAMTKMALALLNTGAAGAYDEALATLHPSTRQAWEELFEDQSEDGGSRAADDDEAEEEGDDYTADAASLVRFLSKDVKSWYEARRKELLNRPLIREQAFGESLDANRLESLGRYEVHLDRKLERMLAMLLRLKDLRTLATSG